MYLASTARVNIFPVANFLTQVIHNLVTRRQHGSLQVKNIDCTVGHKFRCTQLIALELYIIGERLGENS